MTDVLFITQDSAYPQMGVLYLIDALRKQGISSEFIASGASSEMLGVVLDRLKPRLVGMSVMTAPEIADFERHSLFIKANYPGIPVVWGGVHPTLLADVCANTPYIDHVFVGQGEDVFPRFVADLADGIRKPGRLVYGHAPRDIDAYEPAWDHDDISRYLFSERHSVRSPDVRVRDRISRSFHQIERMLQQEQIAAADLSHTTRLTIEQMKKWDVGLYQTDHRLFYYLLTSRGCPYKCTFCSEPLQVMHGDQDNRFKWNAHGVDWVARQVGAIRRELRGRGLEMDGVGIWDDMFWVRHRKDPRANDILNLFRNEGLRYLIEARADQLLRDDAALLRLIADSGCIQVFVGAESASQETLNYMRKGTKVQDYYRLMKLAEEHQVSLRMSFIIGFPHENDASINETLDLCAAIQNGDFGPWVNVSGPKIFTPYPGTVEYTRAVQCGFHPPTTNVEWGGINRSTEEYLHHFPWLERNCSPATLKRLEGHFGKGYRTLRVH
ncbi:MAG: radical SAM protein [Gammaproteobacteria bacterium]